jgi:hypothetical protein
MERKIIGLLVVGLVIALILPIGSATLQKIEKAAPEMKVNKPASQLEITLKGGVGVTAFVKNTGTTDLENATISIVVDGPGIIWGTQKTTGPYLDIKAGKTQIIKSPVLGFGPADIEFTVDTTTQTASGKVLLGFVYGVK